MTEELVRRELRDGVLTLTLNRPEKRNALSPDLFAAVGDAFESTADPAVNAVILRGEGPVFCAGIDLSSLGTLSSAEGGFQAGVERLQSIYMALERIGKPSIAAVHGAAVGAGLQLAMACDLRVVAEGTRLGLFEIRYGIVPDLGGIHRAVQLCGLSRAKDMIMTGRDVGAAEAQAWGLADRVVPAADLDATVAALMGEITSKSPAAVGWAKRLLDQAASGAEPAESLRAVAQAQQALVEGPEFSEAVTAGIERRPAVFSPR